MVAFNITRCAHAELLVKDLEKSKAFYVDALGFVEVASDKNRVFLGGLEERDKYSIILTKAETASVSHISFRVADAEDLEKIAQVYKEEDLPTRWVEANTEEPGQGRALRAHDPSGLPVEFYHEMEQRERLLQKFELYRGANIMRIDHLNCMVPDVRLSYDWWTKKMGFYMSEYTVTDTKPEGLWAAWLHRKQNVHDLALTNGVGPRLHHIGVWAQDTQSVLKACDILASVGMRESIERGPGRHGLSNAFFLYLRDPDGHRIEIYTSDYIIPDPDFKPIKWTLNDPRRATFWGHHPPKSWFQEASLFENINTKELLATKEPLQVGFPEFIT